MYKGIPVVSLDQVAEKVKLIIVIPFYDLEIIRDQICMRMDCRVLGIDEVLETASFYKCERWNELQIKEYLQELIGSNNVQRDNNDLT